MAVIAWLSALGCGTPPLVDAPYALCTDQLPAAPTFTNVRQIFTTTCTRCHTAVELDLSVSDVYAHLIDKPPPTYVNPPTDESCGMVLVKPGDPTASYLFAKLSLATPCAGLQMPLLVESGTPYPLPACEQALVHDWIAAGALDD